MSVDLLDRPRVLVIAGPTASGKSALALKLARRLGGIVVNADSMQVYRDLRVITARPSEADEASVPHALYGMVDGADAFSVNRWLEAVAPVLHRAEVDGRAVLVVGGSGLYLKALTQGLSTMPAVPSDVRQAVRAWAAERTPAALHAELDTIDPATAKRLRPTDPQRLIRAIEVKRATGLGLADYHAERSPPLLGPGHYRAMVLDVTRAHAHARAERRFDLMLERGALEEVDRLRQRNLAHDLPIMRAIGVAPLVKFARGDMTFAEARSASQAQTRQFIKRQATFARTQLPNFLSVKADAAEQYLLDGPVSRDQS